MYFSTHFRFIKRSVTSLFAAIFIVMFALPAQWVQAQPVLNLPAPGTMVNPTGAYQPVMLQGINLYPDKPLQFDFLIDPGARDMAAEATQAESMRLIKYFLASLTVPQEDMWVNLSPYEEDRIIPGSFGQTEMGRDVLAQDYMLKQLMSSLMYPEDELGAAFWKRVYARAMDEFGTTDIPVDTYNKVWIVPATAEIYEHEKGAFVVNSRLKVMMEQDYLAAEVNEGRTNHGLGDVAQDELRSMKDLSAPIIRDLLIPEIEREVNEGEIFANLRQIHQAMILAKWFKENLKESLLGQVYVDQQKTAGVDVNDPAVIQQIYDQYVAAYKKGVFDYIKADSNQSSAFSNITADSGKLTADSSANNEIVRRYFSGGYAGDKAQIIQAAGYDPDTDARSLPVLTVGVSGVGPDSSMISAPSTGLDVEEPLIQNPGAAIGVVFDQATGFFVNADGEVVNESDGSMTADQAWMIPGREEKDLAGMERSVERVRFRVDQVWGMRTTETVGQGIISALRGQGRTLDSFESFTITFNGKLEAGLQGTKQILRADMTVNSDGTLRFTQGKHSQIWNRNRGEIGATFEGVLKSGDGAMTAETSEGINPDLLMVPLPYGQDIAGAVPAVNDVDSISSQWSGVDVPSKVELIIDERTYFIEMEASSQQEVKTAREGEMILSFVVAERMRDGSTRLITPGNGVQLMIDNMDGSAPFRIDHAESAIELPKKEEALQGVLVQWFGQYSHFTTEEVTVDAAMLTYGSKRLTKKLVQRYMPEAEYSFYAHEGVIFSDLELPNKLNKVPLPDIDFTDKTEIQLIDFNGKVSDVSLNEMRKYLARMGSPLAGNYLNYVVFHVFKRSSKAMRVVIFDRRADNAMVVAATGVVEDALTGSLAVLRDKLANNLVGGAAGSVPKISIVVNNREVTDIRASTIKELRMRRATKFVQEHIEENFPNGVEFTIRKSNTRGVLSIAITVQEPGAEGNAVLQQIASNSAATSEGVIKSSGDGLMTAVSLGAEHQPAIGFLLEKLGGEHVPYASLADLDKQEFKSSQTGLALWYDGSDYGVNTGIIYRRNRGELGFSVSYGGDRHLFRLIHNVLEGMVEDMGDIKIGYDLFATVVGEDNVVQMGVLYEANEKNTKSELVKLKERIVDWLKNVQLSEAGENSPGEDGALLNNLTQPKVAEAVVEQRVVAGDPVGPTGGVDFNPDFAQVTVQKTGQGVVFPVVSAEALAPYRDALGFEAVLISVQPPQPVSVLLGR